MSQDSSARRFSRRRMSLCWLAQTQCGVWCPKTEAPGRVLTRASRQPARGGVYLARIHWLCHLTSSRSSCSKREEAPATPGGKTEASGSRMGMARNPSRPRSYHLALFEKQKPGECSTPGFQEISRCAELTTSALPVNWPPYQWPDQPTPLRADDYVVGYHDDDIPECLDRRSNEGLAPGLEPIVIAPAW